MIARYSPFLLVLVLLCVQANGYSGPSFVSDNLNVPCKFLDSINITDGIQNVDGSITFDEITYTSDNYGIFNYEFVNETYRRPAVPHLRGCTCRVRPCVRLCCPRGHIVGNGCEKYDQSHNLSIDIWNSENETSTVQLFEQFSYTLGKPCQFIIENFPETNPEDEWYLYHVSVKVSSTIERGNYNFDFLLNRTVLFCTTTFPSVRISTVCSRRLSMKSSMRPPYDWQPASKSMLRSNTPFCLGVRHCLGEFTRFSVHSTVFSILGMLLSVPFLLATFLVYACLPELRNVHGKCLLCYLVGLTTGYIVLAFLQLNGSNYIKPSTCQLIGYAIYFSFLSAFFWLNVISFDLWWNFR